MKKILIIFALTFGWLMNITAQKQKLYDLFDKYQETEGVTSIKIAKPMFSMLNKLDIKDAELDNIKPMLDKIQGLRILVIEKPEKDSLKALDFSKMMLNFNNLQSEIASSLKSLNYEELITVNSKDNKIKFLAGDTVNGILDNLLLSVNSEGNTVLMMLDGKISMDDVNKLANETQNFSTSNSSEKSGKNSSLTEEERKVANFSGIEVSQGIKVSFTQGNIKKVRVETDADKLQYIKTEVRNDILKVYIDNPNGKNLNFKKLHVDITAPMLNKILATSGSNFTTLNTVKEENFLVEATSGANISADLVATDNINVSSTSGSNMKLNIAAKSLQLNATSGSNTTIVGNAEKTLFGVSSAATVNAQDLKSKTSTISASSAASLKVNVLEKIQAQISSGASVRYRANTTVDKNASISGGGSMKPF